MNKIIFTVLLVISLAGCQTKSLYHWGDYSQTAHKYVVEPSEKTRLKHQEMMLDIVKKSKKKNKKVAPGIYAELGLLAMENNQAEQAISYYEQEAKNFPESKKFMNYLIEKIKELNDA
ncbi:MAG: DUF4810 domain-containing protein [Psychrobium sp.]|nr:DUF4810 domain-containing protein [Psychrobium sp.]